MNNTTYYYKRENGDWVFSVTDYYGVRNTDVMSERAGARYLYLLREQGKEVRKLYLNVPEDYQVVKDYFFTSDYWIDRTWQAEYAI